MALIELTKDWEKCPHCDTVLIVEDVDKVVTEFGFLGRPHKELAIVYRCPNCRRIYAEYDEEA